MNIIKSKRTWVGLLLLTGMVFLRANPVAIAFGGVLLVALFFLRALRPLMNYKFWLTIIILAVLVPIFSGEPDRTLWGISYSSTRFEMTALMVLRGILLFLLFQVLTLDMDSAALTRALRKLRIPGIDSMLPQALDFKPRVTDLARSQYRAYRSAANRTGRISSLLDAAGSFFAELITMAHRSDSSGPSAAEDTPIELLQVLQDGETPALIVVTGPSGAGKSAWLVDQVRKLGESGHNVDGLLVERADDGSERWHQVIQCIRTGEKRHFNSMDEIKGAPHVGRFWFYPEAIAWGSQRLLEGGQADWLVVDEFGLLEAAGEGWYHTLKELATSYTGNLVIAVREQPDGDPIQFLVDQLSALRNLPLTVIRLPE
ncbi:nucleoside-triphosphatase [Candidatus Neomarinimicrobiota bacterium]